MNLYKSSSDWQIANCLLIALLIAVLAFTAGVKFERAQQPERIDKAIRAYVLKGLAQQVKEYEQAEAQRVAFPEVRLTGPEDLIPELPQP